MKIMEYKGWTISKGRITVPGGIEVSGWLIQKDGRRTIADSREMAMKYIDRCEDRKGA